MCICLQIKLGKRTTPIANAHLIRVFVFQFSLCLCVCFVFLRFLSHREPCRRTKAGTKGRRREKKVRSQSSPTDNVKRRIKFQLALPIDVSSKTIKLRKIGILGVASCRGTVCWEQEASHSSCVMGERKRIQAGAGGNVPIEFSIVIVICGIRGIVSS
jgi:hypothetical protein